MKAVISGYGSIGKRHVKNLLAISNYDINIYTEQKNPKSYNKKKCFFFNTLQDCFLGEPTIGFVTNVSRSHVDTALELANVGCHLFIEKPLSNSLQNVEKLSRIIKKNSTKTIRV